MGKYVLPIIIKANSKAEAEEKLRKLLDIAATYKKVTWNDVLGSIVDVLREFEIHQRHKGQQVHIKKRPANEP